MTLSLFSDEHYMREALKQARYALEEDEIPIGAVVVLERQIIARAHNQTEQLRDVTAHAEMLALTAAANHVGNKYLADCTLYVTIEPCVMCAGASFWAQVRRVVYGAAEEKRGFRRYGNLLHPRTELVSGILGAECGALMSEFFARKRK
ncbi:MULTISPECIES: nucleoside deaminase [Hymenobacter]|uniref:tRNA-specific adenosine deaminase n=1 Tax=Hymenobacter jejuensis TaxID=2502781 RepID=A0A5B7ZX87_9BACT|nr:MULTISPECIES: nucleoside deaminase [Hymenobacter]MBC6992472.1 nucleoside deaminase [Hymenobacter sp. BT491]QDA59590.1 nucleoside deaminase [Hymenobacter jejuensis]